DGEPTIRAAHRVDGLALALGPAVLAGQRLRLPAVELLAGRRHRHETAGLGGVDSGGEGVALVGDLWPVEGQAAVVLADLQAGLPVGLDLAVRLVGGLEALLDPGPLQAAVRALDALARLGH